ncbi:GntR family transcriptional regulator [Pontiellaceae bacterium B12227]|nr:GntR family transcriptional regulator [Pontiellaceae bacterium B12227]
MTDHFELFGHQIVVHHQLTFEQQIRDVFVEEIHNGRWKVGDRLPGMLALAKESGFGTKTMYNAFEKMREDGYVEMRGNRGTFLKSSSPNRRTTGKIGLLLHEDQRSVQLILWYQHIILEAAGKRNMITEVRVLPSDVEPVKALQPGVLFSGEVTGVISLTAFEKMLPLVDEASVLPHVFLCPPYESCVPRVSADVEYAYFELTHRMIDAGHKCPAFSYESREMDRRQAELHLNGYRRAMAQRGLEVDEALLELSRDIDNEDLVSVNGYLKKIMAMSEHERPTALVCGSLGRTTILTNMAPLCGVDIPGKLSVGSIGTAAVPGRDNGLMTGMLPDFDKMMDTCFDVLAEYAKERTVSRTAVLMQFKFIPGITMKEMDGRYSRGNEDASIETSMGIDSMSKAVHF